MAKIIYLKKLQKHRQIKIKYKEEMEEVHDNASAGMYRTIKANS